MFSAVTASISCAELKDVHLQSALLGTPREHFPSCCQYSEGPDTSQHGLEAQQDGCIPAGSHCYSSNPSSLPATASETLGQTKDAVLQAGFAVGVDFHITLSLCLSFPLGKEFRGHFHKWLKPA